MDFQSIPVELLLPSNRPQFKIILVPCNNESSVDVYEWQKKQIMIQYIGQ